MTDLSESSAGEWRMPLLTREGQFAFWNRQAPGYALADMTRDNDGEAAIVRSMTFSLVSHNHVFDDVVTLGGAVGSRDPVMIMDILSPLPGTLYFNDLSPEMTRVARTKTLAEYADQGISLEMIPGRIHEIHSQVPHKPRRVIIGVYRAAALLNSFPRDGYPYSGIDEYLRNQGIIGDTLLLEAMMIDEDGRYSETGIRAVISGSSDLSVKENAMLRLWNAINSGTANVIRVVGLHREKEGFFLSHWYSERGILNLVRNVFKQNPRRSIAMEQCAKGFVLCIDPHEPPRGVVTMLNNVLGNILPDEQEDTLAAISRISA